MGEHDRMIAVILAAGLGKRLMPLTKDRPKTLLKIGETTLLEETIKKCLKNGINQFMVVYGYNGDKVIDECRQVEAKYNVRIETVENEVYATTNTSFSLYRALEEMKNTDFIVINGDNVFDEKIIEDLLETGNTSIVVDNVKKLNEESFKIITRNNVIEEMGKDIDIETSSGEFIGISKVLKEDYSVFKDLLSKIVEENPQQYYDLAFKDISRISKISFSYTNGLKWTEIDDMNDWENAKTLFHD